MEILIFIGVIVITILLGRYALYLGHQLEERKEFENNFNNFKTKQDVRNSKRKSNRNL